MGNVLDNTEFLSGLKKAFSRKVKVRESIGGSKFYLSCFAKKGKTVTGRATYL